MKNFELYPLLNLMNLLLFISEKDEAKTSREKQKRKKALI